MPLLFLKTPLGLSVLPYMLFGALFVKSVPQRANTPGLKYWYWTCSKHRVVGAEMASRISIGEIKEIIKVSLGGAGVFALGTYLLPDLRSEWYKEFQAREYEIEAEKAISAYRAAHKAKGQN
ncbi:hypothetical protein AgCh_033793 [Apium graveolens]